MSETPEAPNTIEAAAPGRSTTVGDVPERLKRRYYTDDHGGGLAFYVDAQVERPAFRDQGRRLTATRNDPNAIRDMAAIAQHRGWSTVVVRGAAEFRREAWLAGRAAGLDVQGYKPTERDSQALERRLTAQTRSEDAPKTGRRSRSRTPSGEEPTQDAGAQSHLKFIEAVVRDRVASPRAQDRILARARSRLAALLERGVRFTPLRTPARFATVEGERGRERQR